MLPIAEVFTAPQGEGKFAGTLMIFLRLAGCTVGKRFPSERYTRNIGIDTEHGSYQLPMLPSYTNECTTYDGRQFACDTDYQKKYVMSPQDILSLLQQTHPTCMTVCLTGGEPLMHDVSNLIDTLHGFGYDVHIETSGTIGNVNVRDLNIDHIAVSPKIGFLDIYAAYADEIKILVDENFTFNSLPHSILTVMSKVWLQPVNFEHAINDKNMQRCLDLQLEHPKVKISSQSHKLWRCR